MSYIGSDVDQDNKPANLADFRRQRSSSNLMSKAMESSKISQQQQLWNDKQNNDDTDSEISDSGHFLAKGAFLLTPSHELTMDRAAMICEKMNFKGCFSLTKTATGILFKFSHPEDYQSVFKKGFHKVTGARFYKKVAIPCRPQKTFTLYVFDVPDELPEEDIRHSLYKFNSVVEVVRLVVLYKPPAPENASGGTLTPKLSTKIQPKIDEQDVANKIEAPPSPIRITLASIDEYNYLLQNGLDFYGATFFPTEAKLPDNAATALRTKKGTRLVDGSIPGRVRELLPVFDTHGFTKIPPPIHKTIKPRP
ncbi:hypothetical protein PVAND_012976 [Polypedilum vanderplanki]|uniref:Uncharacterized protein n=1 Tax=Polypedilum vanderplanki TaxID=319348 RepID=A0A9J6CPC0_POLVA|nr:hypothetical protein PVAND_012976 [Polypedilum vanderplanki]